MKPEILIQGWRDQMTERIMNEKKKAIVLRTDDNSVYAVIPEKRGVWAVVAVEPMINDRIHSPSGTIIHGRGLRFISHTFILEGACVFTRPHICGVADFGIETEDSIFSVTFENDSGLWVLEKTAGMLPSDIPLGKKFSGSRLIFKWYNIVILQDQTSSDILPMLKMYRIV
jgi:hypothetical protein